MFDFSHFDLHQFIITLVVLVCSITLHEFGHAFSADRLGDPGPRRDGRISLWPDKHFDPMGFGMMVVSSLIGFGIGWGKPVMVNPRTFRHPNRDMMIVTACGPLMNLLLALGFGIPLRFILENNTWQRGSIPFDFFLTFVLINLSLMFFNLIPIPPLDGSKILYGLLPFDLAARYERFMGQYGMLILLALFLIPGLAGMIIGPPVLHSLGLILGPAAGYP